MNYLITFIEFFAGLLAAVFIFNVVRTLRIPARVRKAEMLFDEHDQHQQALDIVNAVIERKREYVPAIFLKAKILRRQRQYILAIAEANNVLRISDYKKYVPEIQLHYLLADLYSRQQLFHKEIEEYRLILGIAPHDTNANHQMAFYYYRQKKYREARDAFFRAIAGDAKRIDCFLPLGVSCFHLSDYAKAEEFLLKSIESLPMPPAEAYYHLGYIYKMKKDTEAAIKMFEFTRRDPDYALLGYLRIAEIYHDKEDYPKAIETLESGMSWVKSRDETSIQYRYLLADCYEIVNQIKEAVHHWEKIEQEYPNYKGTQMKLADYKLIMNDEIMKSIFTSTLDALSPIITEIISRLNFNIITKRTLSQNQLAFKAFNIKRINDPPLLIFFDRTTREIPESSISRFSQMIREDNCKSGIYIATSRFSQKAKALAASEVIDLLDKEFVSSTMTKIRNKQK